MEQQQEVDPFSAFYEGMSQPSPQQQQPADSGQQQQEATAVDPFNAFYGASATATVTPQDQESQSWLDSVTSDVVQGITEIPSAVRTGAAKAVNELSDIGYSLGRTLNDVVDTGYVNLDLNPETPLWESQKDRDARLSAKGVDPTDPNQANEVQVSEDWGQVDSNTGKLVEGLAQFSVGMVGAGRFIKASGLIGNSVKGAVAGSTVFDPHEQRLSNLVEQYPSLQNPVSGYLAADVNDTEAEGRFKSALENLGLGIGMEALVKGVKALKFGKAGKMDEASAAAQEADDALRAEEVPVDDALKAGDHLPPVGEGHQYELDLGRQTVGDTPSPKAEPKAEVTTQPPGGKGLFEIKPSVLQSFRQELTDNPDAFSPQAAVATRGIDFNFASWPEDGSVQSIVNQMSKTLEGEFRAVKGGDGSGVRSWATVEQNAARTADEFGTDPSLFLQRMASQTADRVEMDSQILAYKTVQVGILQELDRVAQAVVSGVPYKGMTGKGLEEHMDRLFSHGAEVSAMVKGQQTNIARSLNAMKMKVNGAEKLSGAMDNFASWRNGSTPMERARAILAADGDFATKNRLLALGRHEKAFGIYSSYLINSMLSGLKTHATAFLSNIFQTAYQPALRMTGGVMSRDMSMVKEGVYQYIGYKYALNDALNAAWKVMTSGDGKNILDQTERSLEHSINYFDPKLWRLSKDDPTASVLSLIGQVVQVPSRMLSTSDELFKQLIFRGRVYGVAMREAREQGMNPEQMASHIQDKLDNAIDVTSGSYKAGNALAEEALKEARTATFTNPLEYGVGHSLQGMTAKHPWFKIIVPFVRTPTNVMRMAWQHTPGLNLLQRQFNEDLKAGGQRAAIARAKTAMGSLFWLGGVSLALEGKVTGYGPSNPQARDEWLAAGNMPYAFKTVDDHGGVKWISYNRADPFAMFLGISADMVDLMSQQDERVVQDMAMAAVVAITRDITSKSYLKGLAGFIKAIADPQQGMPVFAQQLAGAHVPSILNDVKGDDAMHEVRSILDAVRNRTPGFSETLDPKRNILGDIIHRPTGWGWDLASPFATSSNPTDDPVLNELARLGHGITPPPKKIGNIDLTGDKYRVSKHQTAYDRYLELIGKVEIRGKTLKETLAELIQSERYQQRFTDDVALPDGSSYEGSRVHLIQSVMGKYRDVALRVLMKENPSGVIETDVKGEKRKQRAARHPGKLDALLSSGK